MEKRIWYAVSMRGQGRVFTSKPERNELLGVWCGDSAGSVTMLVMMMEGEGFRLPDITWEDEPVEMKIVLCDG